MSPSRLSDNVAPHLDVTTGDARQHGIKSVENAARVLRVMAQGPASMRLADIAAATGMTRSAARGYLVSLLRTGLVAQDPGNSAYMLGDASLQLGLAALRRVDALQLAREGMSELAALIGETVGLAIWSDSGPVFVATIESAATSMYELRVGAQPHLLHTATGRIFLSWMDEARWRPVLDRSSAASPKRHTPIDRIIDEVRRQGFAMIDTAPGMPSFAGAAAPIFDHSGALRCAIVTVGRFDDTPSRRSDVACALVNVCRRVSERLGYQSQEMAIPDQGSATL